MFDVLENRLVIFINFGIYIPFIVHIEWSIQTDKIFNKLKIFAFLYFFFSFRTVFIDKIWNLFCYIFPRYELDMNIRINEFKINLHTYGNLKDFNKTREKKQIIKFFCSD